MPSTAIGSARRPATSTTTPTPRSSSTTPTSTARRFRTIFRPDITPGPLIPLSQPDGTQQNVSNIDLYVYGSGETDPYYTAPVGAIYLPLAAAQTDYLAITPTTYAGSGPQLIVTGQTAGLFPKSGLTVQLGIYDGGGQFTYVPLPASQNSNTGEVDYWQNYNVSNTGGSWSITSGGPNVEGTFIINGLPTLAGATSGQVYWYQLVFSDSHGDQKVYNFYSEAGATAGSDPDRQRRLRRRWRRDPCAGRGPASSDAAHA